MLETQKMNEQQLPKRKDDLQIRNARLKFYFFLFFNPSQIYYHNDLFMG